VTIGHVLRTLRDKADRMRSRFAFDRMRPRWGQRSSPQYREPPIQLST
jgi:hypothetical protein